MNYLHYELDAAADDVIEVTLDRQANVRMFDAANYAKFTKGEDAVSYGGVAKVSPMSVKAPAAGRWHIVIDLGEEGGQVRASVKVS